MKSTTNIPFKKRIAADFESAEDSSKKIEEAVKVEFASLVR
jgi:hypothetical protein